MNDPKVERALLKGLGHNSCDLCGRSDVIRVKSSGRGTVCFWAQDCESTNTEHADKWAAMNMPHVQWKILLPNENE